MKRLLLIIFSVMSISGFSQKNKKQAGFGSLTAQIPFNEAEKIGFGINMGAKPVKTIGLGAGIEAIGIKEQDNKSGVYLPLYLDARYFFTDLKSIEPFFTFQPGYGFYGYSNTNTATVRSGSSYTTASSSITGSGGFYFGSGFGIRGKGKLSPIITLRYTSYELTYTMKGTYFTKDITSTGRVNGVTINLGISF